MKHIKNKRLCREMDAIAYELWASGASYPKVDALKEAMVIGYHLGRATKKVKKKKTPVAPSR